MEIVASAGFVLVASMAATPISYHMVFAVNSFCHEWKAPETLEDDYRGVHWSVVNGGDNQKYFIDAAATVAKDIANNASNNNSDISEEKSEASNDQKNVRNEQVADAVGVDIHGHAQASVKNPCVGLDNTFLGAWFGDGFHGRHHQNAKHAMHAPRWYLDYHYCTICALEFFGMIWNVQRSKLKEA